MSENEALALFFLGFCALLGGVGIFLACTRLLDRRRPDPDNCYQPPHWRKPRRP